MSFLKCEFHPYYLPFSPYLPTDIVQRREKFMFEVTKEGIVEDVRDKGIGLGSMASCYASGPPNTHSEEHQSLK